MARGAEVKRNILRGLRRRAFGQSLVEFAVALPILLFIIAGIVEVGNIFIQRNRAALVGRETARYVATGGEDHDALVISEQTVEQAYGGEIISFDEEHLNIYVIHATVNEDGDAIIDEPGDCASEDDFCETHIYPTQEYWDTCAPDCVPLVATSGWDPGDIYERLSEISTGGGTETIPAGDLEDLKIVATVVQYNTTTVLNLPIFPQTDGGIPLNEITIMRQETTIAEAAGSPTDGCSVYPIVISDDVFPPGTAQKTQQTLTYGTSGPLHYSYLLWNDDYADLGKRLEDSLGGVQVPFAKRGVVEYPATHPPPLANTKDPVYGYIDDSEAPADTALHKDDPVLRNTNPGGAAAMSMMNDHITDERAIRILEFDTFDGTHFNITGVLIVEIVSLSNITGTMEMEFVREDFSCGNSAG